MVWVEASGKTLEEAVQAAASQLGVPVDQMEVEVLEETAKGLFGLGQPRVRIKATTSDAQAPAAEPEPQPVEGEDDELEALEQEMEGEPGASRGQRAVELLRPILEAMGLGASPVLVSEDEEEVLVELAGSSDDIGRLIGRHGQTLDALQYLIAVAVNRGSREKVRVVLDAEGYRERYRQTLEARAREYARRVKESGEEAVLEPQSPRDRRIVHMTLADDPEIYTYSEGEGEDRHVVISPRK